MKIKYTEEQLEYFRKQGRKGGNKTKKLYGSSHFSRIAKGKLSTATPLVKE